MPRARRALQSSFSLGEHSLGPFSRVRCSVEFLQIFLKEVTAREHFSAAVSLLYTALLNIFARAAMYTSTPSNFKKHLYL